MSQTHNLIRFIVQKIGMLENMTTSRNEDTDLKNSVPANIPPGVYLPSLSLSGVESTVSENDGMIDVLTGIVEQLEEIERMYMTAAAVLECFK